jgi:hypothetical protein
MNEQLTIKKERSHRFWLGDIMCRLFHPIETLANCSFVDSVSGKSVGKFRCKKCGAEYLANNKRDMFRCYV